MVSLRAIRPTFIVELDENLADPAYRREFLNAVHPLLSEIRVDGGAGSDQIYMAACNLTQGLAWNHIDSDTLAEAARFAPAEAVEVFSEGLPGDFGNRFMERYAALQSAAYGRTGP